MKIEFKHKKSLGQNFLINKTILKKISSLKDFKNQEVVEVGPGKGYLTEFLIKKKPSKLILIEKDRQLETVLIDLIKNKNIKIKLIIEDALKISINKLSKNKIVLIGNLPYNVATTLILNWLKYIHSFESIVVMVQKEVASRLSAKEKTKHYGRTSVLVQVVADVKIKFDVAPENFFPKPKVHSSVIEIIPKEKIKFNYKKLDKLLKLSFMHKRKTLKNNLSKLSSNIEEKIFKCGVNPALRPEEISPNQFIKLSEELI
jgi:16S rRNA (adenine1518-N6/adenine1519-N6)-dimethyltransferase